ncbi:ABC transporter ATP-binding protein [Paenibacillus alba]|uniref:ABC transporter ATP-binding protein n=1 Tax=Paenibacillus alba TaxID=1197127 RepID=A0ABU6FYT3_9BACL|nr:ABC transporter ATP-binding protein [Paenibacillus alba]MEC0225699.1 ABC transporter ATP-binding protein [Paenibacillus alba]
MNIIKVDHLSVRYGEHTIISSLTTDMKKGHITTILGPNGCGKSTLLKTLARQMKMDRGSVMLDGREMKSWKPKELARELAFLMQQHDQATDVSVRNLVAYGRFPHKNMLQRLDDEDQEIIINSMEQTGVLPLADRSVASLSGGERQRAWMAMALAQQPRLLFLDEPTTYLDISHQLEVMELVVKLKESMDMTIIMVLHDLNHAVMYSDNLIMMKGGEIRYKGTPEEIVNQKSLAEVFGVHARIEIDAETRKPFIRSMRLLAST